MTIIKYKYWERIVGPIVVLLILGFGALIWATLPDNEPAVPIEPATTTTTVADVEHCGCEGACEKCHHLCLECKCGDHIIDRGPKCQEFAACEAGCSSDEVGVTGAEPGPPVCKHCHKICDDKHGGDANPACQACLAEHCILGAVGVTGAETGCSAEGCQQLAFVGSYLLEPDRFSDPSDGPYVEQLLVAASKAFGCTNQDDTP